MVYVTDDRAILSYSWVGSDDNGNLLTNQPVFITYSFETSPGPLIADGLIDNGPQNYIDSFRALSASQVTAARTAFSLWDAASGVTFLEVPAGLGDIKLANFDFDLGGPYTSTEAAAYGGGGEVIVSASGGYAYTQLYLHEIGHNLGFKHSFEGTYVLDPAIDNYASTVMSYTSGGYSGDTLGTLDRDAITYLYGLPGTDGTQVASWSWDAASATLTQTAFAAGGKIRGVGGSNVINGGPGADDVNINGDTLNNQISTVGGDDVLAICGTVVSNSLATGDGDDAITITPGGHFAIDGGSGTDSLTFYADYAVAVDFSLPAALANGNSMDGIENLAFWGSSNGDHYLAAGLDSSMYGFGGDDILQGGTGNDTIFGYDGNDILQGGLGQDYLSGQGGADRYIGNVQELNGDTIATLDLGDTIEFFGASIGSFSYSLSNNTLSFTGGSLFLYGYSGALQLATGAEGQPELYIHRPNPHLADFSGDGHGDILFRHTSGLVSTWDVSGDGTQVQQGAFNASTAASWKIADTLDWNGDGRSDVLFRNDGGAVAIWTANGSGFDQASYFHAAVDTSWRIAGAGDFTGDGNADLLWQNADGTLSAWSAAGTAFNENSWFHASVGASWLVEGLGDFNGDAQADILWRNTDGSVAIWTADADDDFAEGSYFASGISRTWHIDGIGDFNGDGRDDIVWRNDDGSLSIWRSNGTGFDQGVYNTRIAISWHVAEVADLNADGKADIVWRNDNGLVSTWQSNGAAFDQAVYTARADPAWSIAAHDFVL